MNLKSINQKVDSYKEADRIIKKYSKLNLPYELNNILNTQCKTNLEKSFVISLMFYVENPGKIKAMIHLSKRRY